MSLETGVAISLKELVGILAGGLISALAWIANHHNTRLGKVEDKTVELKETLLKDYPNKDAVDRQINSAMAPTNQRLDIMIGTLGEVVDELKKMNDRVTRVEYRE